MIFGVLSAAIGFATAAPAQEPDATPRVFLLDPALLAKAKQNPNPELIQAARREADAALNKGPFTVTRNPKTPPSGDKHDYMSMARYAWPNPNTPDHLPYVIRDGQSNPEIALITDHDDMLQMQDAVRALALGYYFTGDAKYADRAALLLRTWFLNPDTSMRPNLQYAQSVPGVAEGRGDGIIDSRNMINVIDALGLLASYSGWTREDQKGMNKWFDDYAEWLKNSKNGQVEYHKANNHGTWYDDQAVALALFLDKKSAARDIVEDAKQKRIDAQIKADGSQPAELSRTKAFQYSTFNLTALMDLADYADRTGVDLWNYRSGNGGGIRATIDYLLPYASGDKKWDHKEIEGFNPRDLREPLLRAAAHYHDSKYALAAEKLGKNGRLDDLLLTAPTAAAP